MPINLTLPSVSQRKRGAGEFDPTTIANLDHFPIISKCVAQGKAWQDLARTTPATTAGHFVYVFDCTYTGVRFTAASSGERCILGNSGALWWLDTNGVDCRYTFAGVAPTPLCVLFAHRPVSATTTYAGFSGPNNSLKFKVADNNTTGGYRGGKEAVSNWAFGATGFTSGSDVIVGLNYASTGSARNVFDGVDDGQAIAVQDGLTGNIINLLSNNAGGERFRGRYYGSGCYKAQLTAPQLVNANSLLKAAQGR